MTAHGFIHACFDRRSTQPVLTKNSDISKVWDFKLSVTSKEVIDMGFKGKEIGDKMKELETNKYLRS